MDYVKMYNRIRETYSTNLDFVNLLENKAEAIAGIDYDPKEYEEFRELVEKLFKAQEKALYNLSLIDSLKKNG